MNILIKLGFVLVLYFYPLLIVSQDADFEISIADDSLNILPSKFLNNASGGFVGLVTKAPLYSELSYYTSYLYSIDKLGDTTSVSFAKEDSICVYYDLISVSNGEPGYLLSGLTRSLDTANLLNIFTRVDTNLNILWEKVYKFDFYFGGWSMRAMQLKDSSFLYCCSPGGTNMFLLKLSYQGDSILYRSYSSDSAGEIQSITYNHDSSSFLLHNQWGHTSNNSSSSSCIEIDSNLDQTHIYFYDQFFGFPLSSKMMNNGNLITAGSREYFWPPDVQERQITVYMYDSAFNVLNSINLTNIDTNSRAGETGSIDINFRNCIYVAGTHNLQGLTGHQPSWYYVAKLNDTLGIEYEKYIGGDDYYMLFSVLATKDGGVLLSGTRAAINAPSFHRDGYLIKLDSTGYITSLSENSEIQIKDALVYPNPGNEKLKVRTALKNCSLHLYNTNGLKLLTQSLDRQENQILTDWLQIGTYIYVIEQNNKIVDSGKWIKQ